VIKKPNQQIPDHHLFRQEMGDVVPLKPVETIDSPAPRKLTRPQKLEDLGAGLDQHAVSAKDEQFHINCEQGMTHRKNGVQKRVMQKLKRGQFKVSDQIDLHNMTVASGHTALLEFINSSMSDSLVCIRVIHGKSIRSEHGPRLKLMSRRLLREHSMVLAFSACKPAEGGDGATDVLLRSL